MGRLHYIMKTNNLVRAAVFAAMLCAAAPIAVNIGPIPLTFGTFIIYMAGGVLGKKLASVAVAVYILLGAFGLPVFSGFSGGFGKLFGPTGGYIIGYIPLAYLSGLFIDGENAAIRRGALGMVIGTVVLYAFGTAWFMLQMSKPLLPALTACVLPFLPGDAAKIIVSALCSPVIRRRVMRLRA